MVNWYNYIACFFAGIFLANFVPHFVHGISGDRFPTPFAHPPGKRAVIVNRKRRLGTVQSGRRLHVVSSRESYEWKRPSTGNFLRRDCCNKLNFEREICQQTSRLSRIPPEPDAHRP